MTFNVAVIGPRIGQDHVRNYSAVPDVQVRAVADIDPARLKSCAETYHVPNPRTDYREVLAMPDIDAASVCLPNYLHAPVAIEALQAGKHVLVEKPMAMTAQEAEAMNAEAARCNRTLAVSVNYRWDFALESTWESFTKPGVSVTVMGTKGGAIFNLLAPQGQRLTLFSVDGDTLLEGAPVDIRLPEPPDASAQAHFVRSLRTGHAPDNTGERGVAVMRVLDAVYQSSTTGRDVLIS